MTLDAPEVSFELTFLPAAKPRRSMDHRITVRGRRGGRVLICLLGKFCEMKGRIGVTFSPWKILQIVFHVGFHGSYSLPLLPQVYRAIALLFASA